jgi:hypothetical protein
MRWQRGLLRLWIVLSVFWIAGVGAVTWATFPAEVAMLANPQKPGVPDNKTSFDPDAYLAAKQKSGVPDNKKLTDEDWIPLDEPPGAPPPPSKSVSAPDRSAERLAYVQRAAILGVAPSVLVLVVGAALTWVARGFRT